MIQGNASRYTHIQRFLAPALGNLNHGIARCQYLGRQPGNFVADN
jgi:hypothetical protein